MKDYDAASDIKVKAKNIIFEDGETLEEKYHEIAVYLEANLKLWETEVAYKNDRLNGKKDWDLL